MKRLHVFASLACLLIICVLSPLHASADVNDFVINSFQSDETLSNRDPQGELHIVERITVTFSDYNHGLLRAIPGSYKKHPLQLRVNSITSGSGAPSEYTTNSSNGNTVLKIGSPNRTVTGLQEYTIDYTLHNVITSYKDHDELYWDVNGDQWQQTFTAVTNTLHLAGNIKQEQPPVCYTGAYHATAQNCAIIPAADGFIARTTASLQPQQTLTYVAGFKKGNFQAFSWKDELHDNARSVGLFLLFFVPLAGGGVLFWFARGRDPRGSGVIVPQYDPPDNLKPLAVGALQKFTPGNAEITATIIDLAVRRYIKIIETKKNHLIGSDTLEYSLQLTKSDFSLLDTNEALLMNALFNGANLDHVIELGKSGSGLYKTAQTMIKNTHVDMVTNGYFTKNLFTGATFIKSVVSIGIFLVVLPYAVFHLGIAALAGFILGAVIAAFALSKIDARTVKGVAALEYAQGLKLYLNVAEKDRIKALQSPNAPYATGAGEPVRTVELFEKLLPYAMVLGVEKQWAKQFEGLYATPPDWYGGNFQNFNAYYLATSLSSGINTSVNNSFSAPSSSGSSGFGGGGFSGGGGGGGGGGGW